MVLTRDGEEQTEILVTTVWQSLEAIQQFAGLAFERAVVDEEAVALLTEFDERVHHFEIATMDIAGVR
jgi:heme-degrading monooxygenase HmoA